MTKSNPECGRKFSPYSLLSFISCMYVDDHFFLSLSLKSYSRSIERERMEGSSDKRLGKMEKDMYHIIHKVPSGDGPFVKAKQAQVCSPKASLVLVIGSMKF